MESRPVEKPLRLTAVSGVLWLAATAVLPGVGAQEASFYDPDGKALPFGSYEEVEEFLASADIVWKEKLPAGTNKQKRKVLLEKEGSRAHAILRTSYEIKDSPGGGFVDSYLSELAAYELAKLLGLDNVPPVVRRKGGSLQIWIEKATTDAARRQAGEEPADPESFEQQVMDMHVFDNLIANTDRNPGNIIIDGNGKVWFIDHTRSFAGQTELKYPDQLEGCSRELWQRLQGVSDQDIRDAVGSYVKTYLQELLLRRKLLIEELARRMADAGEAELRAADPSR